MKTLAALVALCIYGANVSAAEGADDDPGRWRIDRGYSEGEPGNPWVDRNRKDPKLLVVEPSIDHDSLVRILLENPHRMVWSTDGNGDMTLYSLYDTRPNEEVREWKEAGCRKYLIEPPIDGYTMASDYAGSIIVEGGNEYLPFGATRAAHYELAKPHRGRCTVFVYIGAPTTEGDGFFHAFFSSHVVSGPRITDRHGGLVVESKWWQDGFRTTRWVSDGLIIGVRGQVNIDEVVQAYVEKYPSTLPDDLQFDDKAWGRRELQTRLTELRERVELPDDALTYRPPPTFEQALSRLAQTFDLAAASTEHRRERKRLRGEHISGKEWRQDYEGYWRELVALRRRTLDAILARYEGKALGFDSQIRKFVPTGNASTEPSRTFLLLVGAICGIAVAGAASYVWLRKRRGARGV